MRRCTEIMRAFLEIQGIGGRFCGARQSAAWAARLYDRIMNLYKHFCKALDSTGKLAIMVLALRNKEC